jgi:plastocyanin
MDSRWLGVIVLLIIVVAGGWYIFSNPVAAPEPTDQVATTTDSGAAGGTLPAQVVVRYTDEGFMPAEVTVPVGRTVTWTNESSGKMWVASAMHPDHVVYGGTNRTVHCAEGYTGSVPFDQCVAVDPGASYTFTFDKQGTWKYHDHINASRFGSVIVTEAVIDAGASTTIDVL